MHNVSLIEIEHILEIHFYTADGVLELVMKKPTAAGLLEEILKRTDEHDLINIERRGQIIEICEHIEDYAHDD